MGNGLQAIPNIDHSNFTKNVNKFLSYKFKTDISGILAKIRSWFSNFQTVPNCLPRLFVDAKYIFGINLAKIGSVTMTIEVDADIPTYSHFLKTTTCSSSGQQVQSYIILYPLVQGNPKRTFTVIPTKAHSRLFLRSLYFYTVYYSIICKKVKDDSFGNVCIDSQSKSKRKHSDSVNNGPIFNSSILCKIKKKL